MARPIRIEFPGAVYHVTARGNSRQDVFRDDADRLAFLDLFDEVRSFANWRCHAYCLMTNHYHLILEATDGVLASGMRQLNGIYALRFNRRHRRVGHVFQGRYQAILVERATHLRELARYVVLNPVRAGIVRRPENWPWSSYRATIGMTPPPAWLALDFILDQFATGPERATAYARFVAAGLEDRRIWGDLKNQIFLGGDCFVRRTLEQARVDGGRAEIPRVQVAEQPVPTPVPARVPRTERGRLARDLRAQRLSLREIARTLGMHYSTVSRLLRDPG